LAEKRKLEQRISTLERDIETARSQLMRVPVGDRVGYWYVIDPATGKKAQASYKDPGAVWSLSWPQEGITSRTKQTTERMRIQSDIEKMEAELSAAKDKVSKLSR
jgi:hypothetical protein